MIILSKGPLYKAPAASRLCCIQLQGNCGLLWGERLSKKILLSFACWRWYDFTKETFFTHYNPMRWCPRNAQMKICHVMYSGGTLWDPQFSVWSDMTFFVLNHFYVYLIMWLTSYEVISHIWYCYYDINVCWFNYTWF